jgi:hypothetical protein
MPSKLPRSKKSKQSKASKKRTAQRPLIFAKLEPVYLLEPQPMLSLEELTAIIAEHESNPDNPSLPPLDADFHKALGERLRIASVVEDVAAIRSGTLMPTTDPQYQYYPMALRQALNYFPFTNWLDGIEILRGIPRKHLLKSFGCFYMALR